MIRLVHLIGFQSRAHEIRRLSTCASSLFRQMSGIDRRRVLFASSGIPRCPFRAIRQIPVPENQVKRVVIQCRKQNIEGYVHALSGTYQPRALAPYSSRTRHPYHKLFSQQNLTLFSFIFFSYVVLFLMTTNVPCIQSQCYDSSRLVLGFVCKKGPTCQLAIAVYISFVKTQYFNRIINKGKTSKTFAVKKRL